MNGTRVPPRERSRYMTELEHLRNLIIGVLARVKDPELLDLVLRLLLTKGQE